MTGSADIAESLRQHLAVCRDLLAAAEREAQAFRDPASPNAPDHSDLRRLVLPQLNASLNRLRECRMTWQRMGPSERAQHPEVPNLLRQNQDLIMKIIVLERDNDQSRLRRGLLPANQLPPLNRQRPHFVADLYRRAASS